MEIMTRLNWPKKLLKIIVFQLYWLEPLAFTRLSFPGDLEPFFRHCIYIVFLNRDSLVSINISSFSGKQGPRPHISEESLDPVSHGRDYNLGASQRLYRCALPKEST
eukprot:sb/3477686/